MAKAGFPRVERPGQGRAGPAQRPSTCAASTCSTSTAPPARWRCGSCPSSRPPWSATSTSSTRRSATGSPSRTATPCWRPPTGSWPAPTPSGRNLIGGHGVLREKVSCHYEFIEPPGGRPRAGPGPPGPVRHPRRRPPGRRIRDGHLAQGPRTCSCRPPPTCVRRRPDLDVHFVWVGDAGDEQIPVEQDIAKLGLAGRVHFVGELSEPADLFAELDVFCLTSRRTRTRWSCWRPPRSGCPSCPSPTAAPSSSPA